MANKDIEVKINLRGCDAILSSSGASNACLDKCFAIANAAAAYGGPYDAVARQGTRRAYAVAATTNRYAVWANAKHNALAKAMMSA